MCLGLIPRVRAGQVCILVSRDALELSRLGVQRSTSAYLQSLGTLFERSGP